MLSLFGYQIMPHFHKSQPGYIPAKEYGRMPVKEWGFHRLPVYILNCSHATIESGRGIWKNASEGMGIPPFACVYFELFSRYH